MIGVTDILRKIPKLRYFVLRSIQYPEVGFHRCPAEEILYITTPDPFKSTCNGVLSLFENNFIAGVFFCCLRSFLEQSFCKHIRAVASDKLMNIPLRTCGLL